MNSNLFKVVIFAVFAIIFNQGNFAKAAIYQTINPGNFNNSAIWSPSMPYPYWGWTDTIIINHDVNFNSGFTMYGTMIISGSGSLTGANSLSINHQGVLVNSGAINISALNLDWGAYSTSVNNGSITLSGSLTLNYGKLTNNSTLNIGGNLVNGFHASFENTSTGSITVQGSVTNSNDLINSGSMTVDGSFSNDYNSSISNSGIVSAGGDFTSYQTGDNTGQISSGANMVFVGQFSNEGGITSTGSITNGSGSNFTNSGELNAGTNLVNSGGTITNASTGTIDAGGNIQNTATINNSGTLTSDGAFTNDWGSTLNNSGSFYSVDNVTNNGSLSNSGDFATSGDLTNNNTITNSNEMEVGGSLTNNWSTITNEGVLSVTEDVTNTGGITNEGNFLVDGTYDGAGNVTGTGNLCNSDGSTNPTTGEENVDCNICGGEEGNLPVGLVSFTAHEKNGNIEINWQTASEINNHFFKVLKSTDGLNFNELKTVEGAGNSNILLSYRVLDVEPIDGLCYYRLLQMDFDGKFEYSPTVVVRTEENIFKVRIPSIVKSGELVTIENSSQKALEITLLDMAGRKYFQAESADILIYMPTQNLNEGMYFIEITNGNEAFSTKILVTKNY